MSNKKEGAEGMRSEKIQDAVGLVRDEYIEDAKYYPKKKKFGLKQLTAIAACMCLVTVSAKMLPEMLNKSTEVETLSPVNQTEELPKSEDSNAQSDDAPLSSNSVVDLNQSAEYESSGKIKDYAQIMDSSIYCDGPITEIDPVANGLVSNSIGLEKAIDELKDVDNRMYNVVVAICKDGKVLDLNSGDPEVSSIIGSESERLYNLGYITVYESSTNQNGTSNRFAIHATADQILNFVPADDLGYMLMFYKEAVPNGSQDPDTRVYNQGSQTIETVTNSGLQTKE